MHIILGITGSIAAYKSCSLVRLFVKEGHEVQVVMTPAAKEFVTPLTLSTLSRGPVVSEFFDRRDGSWHSHVDLATWADVMVIAPATASTIGKMVHGIADNMLITTYLSQRPTTPIFVCPAMDLDMYAHPSTQHNLQQLTALPNHYLIEPTEGELASSLVGKGRMEEPETIHRQITTFIRRYTRQTRPNGCDKTSDELPLLGRRIMITAGPTREQIDPVRYISNGSSGKMGVALAEACTNLGADVDLVCGPISIACDLPFVTRHDVTSAAEMQHKAEALFSQCDAAILAAAVSDFTLKASATKLKREGSGGLRLDLTPTQDIAANLGRIKQSHQRLVGFALETNDGIAHAKDKMQRKNLDFIVLNTTEHANPIGSDDDEISIITRDGDVSVPETASKKEWARRIALKLAQCLKTRVGSMPNVNCSKIGQSQA